MNSAVQSVTNVDNLNAFRSEVRAFLDESLSEEMRSAPRTIMLLDTDMQQRWHRILAFRGWAVPGWPVEYGGTGWSAERRNVLAEELVRANAPPLSPNLQMIGPVLYTFGTDYQKALHLGPLKMGETLWCQGYSEPEAGSDLAALRLSALRNGDDYVLNGQKLWTSYAHKADWMFCLVRTGSDGSTRRQSGISFLLVDMRTSGITVRPIRSIDGLHHLNEVFFADARVPVANRVGAENEGWAIAKFLLQHERGGVANSQYLRMRLLLVDALAAESPDDDGSGWMSQDGDFVHRRIRILVDLLALECLAQRTAQLGEDGQGDLRASMLKLRGSEIEQAIGELGLSCLGPYSRPDNSRHLKDPGIAAIGAKGGPEVMLNYLLGRAATIYGGSSEVQRNIIFRQIARSSS
jgi:alkylation response protein AidB-like acyl-CoA dehydrogenase